MFARKFSSDGRMRCPPPWRGRKATRLPRSVPITYGPDGSPNGVAIVRSSRSVTSAMSYSPLPPMIPIWTDMHAPAFTGGWWLVARRHHRTPSVLFLDPAGCDDRIVLEEDEYVARDRLVQERLLRRQRVHRIEVGSHDP